MNAATLSLADVPVEWTGLSEHTTQRGRVKPVLTGIPGSRFWYSYKHHAEFRLQLRAAQIAPHRITKGQWSVVCWINRHNAHLVEALGFQVPVTTKQTEPQPF